MPRKKKVEVVEANDVKVEAVADVVVEDQDLFFPVPDYDGAEFSEALRTIGERADYANRKRIANLNGYGQGNDYLSLGAQNKDLLLKLKAGVLLKK